MQIHFTFCSKFPDIVKHAQLSYFEGFLTDKISKSHQTLGIYLVSVLNEFLNKLSQPEIGMPVLYSKLTDGFEFEDLC